MRRKIMPLLLAGAAACATQGPVAYVASLPATGEGPFACAFRAINEMGFTVTSADRDAGFISAEKHLNPTSGPRYHDKLTVAIFNAAGAGDQTLRVVAMDAREATRNSSDFSGAPSAHGSAAARMLVQACAPGAAAVQQRASAGVQVQAQLSR